MADLDLDNLGHLAASAKGAGRYRLLLARAGLTLGALVTPGALP